MSLDRYDMLHHQESIYPIMQCNGQRIYAPFNNVFPEPPRGSEVFVGNLPRDLLEDELIPHFAEASPIYRLRLMMDFDERSRGFAFVTYFTVQGAKTAVSKFNGTEVSSKSRDSIITVTVSVDNRRLYLGNIPCNKTQLELEMALTDLVDSIDNVVLYMDRYDPRKNRGFAFVEFSSHASAAIAKRTLQNVAVDLFENQYEDESTKGILIDWAEPEPVVDPELAKEVKILYFKNVPVEWEMKDFRQAVLKFGVNRETIERVYKKENYAFVHFFDRVGAKQALNRLLTTIKSIRTNGKRMEVEWAKPMIYSKKYRPEIVDNLCTSVPAQQRKIVAQTKNLQKLSNSQYSSSTGSDYHSMDPDEDFDLNGLIQDFNDLFLKKV